MSELPKGWAIVGLGGVTSDFQAGFASGEKDTPNGVSHLRMNNIGLDGRLVLDLVRTVPKEMARPQHNLSPGDVLVCTTNSGKLVGKCAFFDLNGRFAFSNHLTRLRPIAELADGRFLNWNLWLAWRSGTYDEKVKHWVNQSALPREALLETEIVLPPLAEQRRIVAKLEALLGKVDDCRKRLDKIPVLLKRFRQSVLAAACSGRLTADWREGDGSDEGIPASWQVGKLEDVLESLKYGTSLKSEYGIDGHPVLRIPNIGEGVLDPTDLKYADIPEREYAQLRLKTGDLLMIRSNGSTSLVGKTAIVREGEVGFAYAGYLIRLRVDDRKATSKFINMALASQPVRDQIEIPLRSTSGVNNINSTEVRNLAVPSPPIPEQHEIVCRVEGLFAAADQIEARYAKARAHVDRLTHSILSKAFRGELVPQDPDDEPSGALLERIREQHASAVAALATRKPRSGGGTAPMTLEPATPPPARRGRPPKAALNSPDMSAPNGGQANILLSKPARKILKRMKPGREHARADLADQLDLSVSVWNLAIRELKSVGIVVQTGERRGARYRKAAKPRRA